MCHWKAKYGFMGDTFLEHVGLCRVILSWGDSARIRRAESGLPVGCAAGSGHLGGFAGRAAGGGHLGGFAGRAAGSGGFGRVAGCAAGGGDFGGLVGRATGGSAGWGSHDPAPGCEVGKCHKYFLLDGFASVSYTHLGDRYVLEEMLLEEYSFGGEQSGHIIFRDFATTGDGQLTAIQLLCLLKREDVYKRQSSSCADMSCTEAAAAGRRFCARCASCLLYTSTGQ